MPAGCEPREPRRERAFGVVRNRPGEDFGGAQPEQRHRASCRFVELDVVGDDEALECCAHPRAGLPGDVEQDLLLRHHHPEFADDAPLLVQEQGPAPLPGHELRDLVAQHALQERAPVRTGHDQQRALRPGGDGCVVAQCPEIRRERVSVGCIAGHGVGLAEPASCVPDSPMAYTDISYRVAESTAWITIERPEVKNAFRPETVDELVAAFHAAWRDRTVAVAVLSGANDTFCSGGDQSGRDVHGYGDRPGIGLDMAGLHGALRGIPKPVIAMVDGFAIGGAPRLHPLPPLTPPTHCPAITCAAASGEAPPCTICMKARVIPAGSRCWMMLRP